SIQFRNLLCIYTIYFTLSFVWKVGGSYTFPQDKDEIQYHYDRGFSDVFSTDNDVPFPSFL
ncbi:MAG: hypothetical protein ACTH90_07175, partial [Leuconostoc mesenteroides]